MLPFTTPAPDDVGGFDPGLVRRDVAALSELAATGVEVDGQLQVADSTWIIYGHISYDGEVVVGVYQDAVEASEVLRATPRRGPVQDRPVP